MISYNFDKFSSGEIPVLYILGYSGAGKTTLSKKLAKTTNSDVIIFDNMTYIECLDIAKRVSIYRLSPNDKRIIVDGIHILPLYENSFMRNELFNSAFIIVDTGLITSIFRRLIRNIKKMPFEYFFKYDSIRTLYSRYKYDMTVLNKIKDRLNEEEYKERVKRIAIF